MKPYETTEFPMDAVKAAQAFHAKMGRHAVAYASLRGYSWISEQTYNGDATIHPFQCFYWTRRTGMDQRDLDAANHYITEQRERLEQEKFNG